MRKSAFERVADALGKRLAELIDGALKTRGPACSICGCSREKPCAMKLDDAGGRGQCADMRPYGIDSCSACMTPELRIENFWSDK